MSNYTIKNWYWIVAGNAGAYSSAANVYVPLDDEVYVAWTESGNAPTPIPSEVELWGVMQSGMPGVLPDWLFDGVTFSQPAPGEYSKAQLTGYAALRRYEKEVGGMVFSALPIATDRQSQAMINGAYNLVSASSSATMAFKTSSGFVTLNADQIKALAVAVGMHVQSCFTKEAVVGVEISAGSVATLEAVDSAFAAA